MRRALLMLLVPLAVAGCGKEQKQAAEKPAAEKPAAQQGDPLDEAYRPKEKTGPRAVRALPPGTTGKQQGGSEERIRKEDKALRRDLEDLRALEAADRRVQKLLGARGAGPILRGSGDLIFPVNGSIVSPFGQRWGRLHAGIDLASPAGTPIRAAQTGQVVIAGPVGGYGNYVCIQHTRSFSTCYAHLSRFLTRKGAAVRQGHVIGLVGCTGHCFGDHLHFETRVGGRPVDPQGYL
ncbi:MAG TPA: M23 family metallopeptidase [Thermoleophilaceae bacterium]|nr:M23 family metallopeptidase [Thermoleophilaceae bacterium]